MFTTEKLLYKFLRSHTQDEFHWQRIESVGEGIPDTNYCGRGCEGWLELKVIHNRMLSHTMAVDIGLRPSQAAWLLRRTGAGGRANVCIGTVKGDILIVPAKYSTRLLHKIPFSQIEHWALFNRNAKEGFSVGDLKTALCKDVDLLF